MKKQKSTSYLVWLFVVAVVIELFVVWHSHLFAVQATAICVTIIVTFWIGFSLTGLKVIDGILSATVKHDNGTVDLKDAIKAFLNSFAAVSVVAIVFIILLLM